VVAVTADQYWNPHRLQQLAWDLEGTRPLLALIAVAIVLRDRGPVIYRQRRVCRDAHVFTMYKFRTMIVDADRVRQSLLESNEAAGPLFKLRKDPRVTRIGVLLRRYSLDELPQLFNVLSGRMSLVGPRPPLPEETAGYAPTRAGDCWSNQDSPGSGRSAVAAIDLGRERQAGSAVRRGLAARTGHGDSLEDGARGRRRYGRLLSPGRQRPGCCLPARRTGLRATASIEHVANAPHA
jgi:hypothetical protein